MKTTWQIIESFVESHVLPEEKMYRGETGIRMKDIEALFGELRQPDPKTKQPRSSDPKVTTGPNPKGDVVTCSYSVDSRVWGRWSRSINFAKIMGVGSDDQHPGRPQGGMMHKTNYGGRVVHTPGKPRTDFERMPSAMDRYDVIMIAEVGGAPIPATGNVQFPTSVPKGDKAPSITVSRIAFSPAIGSTEERQQRLEAILKGAQAGPLVRRPQPDLPEPPKDSASGPEPQDVPRVGGRMGMGGTPSRKRDD